MRDRRRKVADLQAFCKNMMDLDMCTETRNTIKRKSKQKVSVSHKKTRKGKERKERREERLCFTLSRVVSCRVVQLWYGIVARDKAFSPLDSLCDSSATATQEHAHAHAHFAWWRSRSQSYEKPNTAFLPFWKFCIDGSSSQDTNNERTGRAMKHTIKSTWMSERGDAMLTEEQDRSLRDILDKPLGTVEDLAALNAILDEIYKIDTQQCPVSYNQGKPPRRQRTSRLFEYGGEELSHSLSLLLWLWLFLSLSFSI